MGKQKPSKPAAPQLLFHEALGRELTDKFTQITTQTVRRSSVATFFATGSIESAQAVKPAVLVTEAALPLAEIIVDKDPDASPPPAVQPFPETKNVLAEHTDHDSEGQSKSYSLSDLNAFQAVEQLVSRYGRMTHMGVRDHNYDLFLNKSKTGVISYRLVDERVAVISGDPICPVSQYLDLLNEFQHYCKERHWQWAMQGGSPEMAKIAKEKEWTTVHYGRERALNVQTNPVLLGTEGKRVKSQCKSLQKTLEVDVYCPAYARDHNLEKQIVQMYDDWRGGRNTSRSVQAYITVFDLMAFHRLMVFVYVHENGKLVGFAALRRLKEGYHIDPITVAADAPRGTNDLLLISSMALLRESKVTRLVLGVEPLDELGEICGMSKPLERLTRKSQKIVSAEIHQGGKKGFNDRFRPDEAFEEQLYMIYPNSPGIKQSIAMAHFANISLHSAIKQRIDKEREKRRRNSDPEIKLEAATADPLANAKHNETATHAATVRNSPPTSVGLPTLTDNDPASASSPDLLVVPSRHQRASSLSRLFKRMHSDGEVRLNMDPRMGRTEQSEHTDNLHPPIRDRSSSRNRFFRRISSHSHGESKPSLLSHANDSVSDVPAVDVTLKIPPTAVV